MKELKKDVLYSFDEKVRVEIGPQIIELDCTDKNLSNGVTHSVYQIGMRDAYGRFIRPDDMGESDDNAKNAKQAIRQQVAYEKQIGVYGVVNSGEKMACVDRKAVHVPFLWKVYQMQKTDELRKVKGKPDKFEPVFKFIKINEFKDKKEALAFAKTTFEGMQ